MKQTKTTALTGSHLKALRESPTGESAISPGMALASVRRNIARHGGRTWAEGKPAEARRSISPYPGAGG